MAATIVGNTGPVTNGLRRSWTRGEGHTTVRTIEGPYTQVEALYNEYAAAGSASGVDQMTLDKIGAKGVLTCTTFDDSGDGTGGENAARGGLEEPAGDPGAVPDGEEVLDPGFHLRGDLDAVRVEFHLDAVEERVVRIDPRSEFLQSLEHLDDV